MATSQKKQRQKTTYEAMLPSAINTCISELKKLKAFTANKSSNAEHPDLEDDGFYKNRQVIYKRIFDSIFTLNGQTISPSNSSPRKHLLIAGTYTRANDIFLEKLLQKSDTIPSKVRQSFNKVNDGHTIIISRESILSQFPEYQTLKNTPFLSIALYDEINIIQKNVLHIAKKCGYNIIDATSKNSTKKTQNEVDIISGRTTKSGKAEYAIRTIGLVGMPETFFSQPLEGQKNMSARIRQNYIKSGLKNLASSDSLEALMKLSDEAYLVWDNGSDEPTEQYELVAATKKKEISIVDESRWKDFKQFQYLGSNSSVTNDYHR